MDHDQARIAGERNDDLTTRVNQLESHFERMTDVLEHTVTNSAKLAKETLKLATLIERR